MKMTTEINNIINGFNLHFEYIPSQEKPKPLMETCNVKYLSLIVVCYVNVKNTQCCLWTVYL